jgi:hypothetical protein
MFAKLLKHEWKANSGLLGILSLGALGAGLLGAFVLKGLLYIEKQNAQNDTLIQSTFGLSSTLTFIIIALVAYFFAVQFINIFHFYKNKFTDEGYLTFTLPVSTGQIFLSSFLNILLWLVISTLVLMSAASMIIFIGASEPLKEYAWELRVMLESISDTAENEPGYRLYSFLSAVTTIVTPAYTVILIMTSIVIGCVLAKKHKILASIGTYYVINFAVSILEPMIDITPTIILGVTENYNTYMNASLVFSILLRIGLGIGGYFLSVHLMENKLNLS